MILFRWYAGRFALCDASYSASAMGCCGGLPYQATRSEVHTPHDRGITHIRESFDCIAPELHAHPAYRHVGYRLLKRCQFDLRRLTDCCHPCSCRRNRHSHRRPEARNNCVCTPGGITGTLETHRSRVFAPGLDSRRCNPAHRLPVLVSWRVVELDLNFVQMKTPLSVKWPRDRSWRAWYNKQYA